MYNFIVIRTFIRTLYIYSDTINLFGYYTFIRILYIFSDTIHVFGYYTFMQHT